jgi:hypothetical protein
MGGVAVRVNLPVMSTDSVGALLGVAVLWAVIVPHFLAPERVALSLVLVLAALMMAVSGQIIWLGVFPAFVCVAAVVRLQQLLLTRLGEGRE